MSNCSLNAANTTATKLAENAQNVKRNKWLEDGSAPLGLTISCPRLAVTVAILSVAIHEHVRKGEIDPETSGNFRKLLETSNDPMSGQEEKLKTRTAVRID
eukprot:scaffold2751_cov42-Prasinocladus_malaysianus.AAC.1